MMLSKNHKTILANISYLSVLNALGLVLPLLLIPYLTRTIGAAYFGDYAYVLAITQNVIMVTTYGFNFSATRQISTHREDAAYINRIFNATLAAKGVIATAVILILVACTPWLMHTTAQKILFYSSLGMVLGDIFIPVWLYQGMEKMKYVTITTATAKILFTLLVFVVIRTKEQYIYTLAMDSVGYLLAGIIAIVLARKQFGIRLQLPTQGDVATQLKDGFAIFCSTFFINLYRNLNIILLKFFVPMEAVGIYAVAEKVIKASQSVVTPITQALYPHFGKQFVGNTIKNNIATLRRLALPIAGVTILLSAVLLLCSNYIHLVVGHDFLQARGLMFIMMPVLTLGALNYLLGFIGLINLGRKSLFLRAVMYSGIVSIAILLLLVTPLGVTAAAIAMTMSEVLLFLLCLRHLYRQNKQHGNDIIRK